MNAHTRKKYYYNGAKSTRMYGLTAIGIYLSFYLNKYYCTHTHKN